MSAEPRTGFLRALANGGWVVVVALLLATAVVGWHTANILRHSHARATGDGKHVESYGFRLDPTLIPTDQIVASGLPKDGLPALVDPAVWTAQQVEDNGRGRGRLLVPSDRVIGVIRNGKARAYPLRIVQWHEVVNDTLGGEPILITYSPLCDSAVVFRRTVGGDAAVFGFSGLLLNSNLLLYDHQPDTGDESLWSQLGFRAVAGRAAVKHALLEPLPAAVVPWGWWHELHADSSVLAPDPQLAAQYARDPYASYFGSDALRFPVAPLPPADGQPLKAPLVAVCVGDTWHAYPLSKIAADADTRGEWSTTIDSTPLTFRYRERPPAVLVDAPAGVELPTIYAFRFAWFAAHPQQR